MAAITPRYSTLNAPFSTTSTVMLYSGDLSPTPCIIPAAQLPSGGDFLVMASAAYGASDASSNPEVALSYGRTTNLLYSSGEGNAHGIPEAMRTGHLAGFARLSTDGTKDLEIGYRTLNAARILYMQGLSIVAIQLNQSGSELIEGTDFWHTAQVGNVDLVDQWTDVLTLTAPITEAGEYMLLASENCYAYTSSPGEQRHMRIMLNSVFQHKKTWIKEIEDGRDNQPFTVISHLTLGAGTHTITIQGSGTGVGTKRFYNGNLWLIRKAAFRSIVTDSGGADNQLYFEYSQSRQQINSPKTFTPSGTEDVVVLGNGYFRRGNAGAIISRLYNYSTGALLHDFCTDINVSEIDQDVTTQFCCAGTQLSAARTFSYEASGEDGYGSYPYAKYDYPELVLWGMTLAGTATPDHEQTITEPIAITTSDNAGVALTTVPIIDSGVAISDYSYNPADNLSVETIDDDTGIVMGNDSVSSAIVSGSGGVPETRPRIYLNPTKLAALRADAGYDDQGNVVGSPSTFYTNFVNQGTKEPWHKALLYKITGVTSWATQAIATIDGWISSSTGGNLSLGGDSSYLYYRDYMRSVALCLDWLYDMLTPAQRTSWMDFMDAAMYVCWNEDSLSNEIYNDNDWATSDPSQNYWPQKMCGTVYVLLATYYERRSNFTWAGTQGSKSYQNRWEFAPGSSGTQIYTDLETYIIDKYEVQGGGIFDSMAGGWVEGQNYSRAAKRSLGEAFFMLKDTAGLDYFINPAHIYMRETVEYSLHYIQPGAIRNNADGDCSGGTTDGGTNDYDRILFLWLASGLKGTIQSQWAQYFLQNDYTHITPGHTSSANIAMDFFMYDATLPARDYGLDLALGYNCNDHAIPAVDKWVTGFVNSRSDWTHNAISVSMHARNNWRGHQHQDNGTLHFYRGIGSYANDWVCCEAQGLLANNSDGATAFTSTHWHNSIVIGGNGQRKDPRGSTNYPAVAAIERFSNDDARGYCYWRMQGDDAYWTNAGSGNYHGDVKINDIWKREVIHIRPGYVVTFDRVRKLPAFASSVVEQCWHYPNNPTVNSNLIQADSGTNRIFQRVVLPGSPTITTLDESSLDPILGSYRATVTGTTAQFEEFLLVHLVTSTATSALVDTPSIASGAGNMKGVHVQDTTTEAVVMFSAAQDGASPSNVDYSYEETGTPCVNYVCDLKANTGYDIVTSVVSTTRHVTILEGGFYQADAGGVLVFDPADLDTPPDFQRIITESPIQTSDAITLDASYDFNENTVTVTGDSVSSFLYPAPADSEEITEADITLSDSVYPTPLVPVTDSGVALSDSVASHAGIPKSDTITIGADSVSVTVFGGTAPPDEPPPSGTGIIDTRVEMSTPIDRGPTWQ